MFGRTNTSPSPSRRVFQIQSQLLCCAPASLCIVLLYDWDVVLARRLPSLECTLSLSSAAVPGSFVWLTTLSGGLGHFAIMFANALGAEVYVISHSPSKKEDALKMGAKEFICSGDKDWNKPYAFTFDFILNCADATHTFDMDAYMGTMKVMGRFHNVGLPDEPLPPLKAQQFA